ncbi:C40 family peptidase [Georgenia sp. Z1491]|uniref:C40 family peptidase n=1 Tax=Georgenia sp. Z1491 TaxID=3416707 RepID=UPI003CF7B1D0
MTTTFQGLPARRTALAAVSASMIVAVAATSAAADPAVEAGSKSTERISQVSDRVVPTNAALTVAADATYDVETASVFGTADAAPAPEPEPEPEPEPAPEPEPEPVEREAAAASRTDERAEAPEPAVEEAAPQAETQTEAATQAAAEPAPAPAASASGSAAVSIALQYQGAPYVWGGTSPSGWDCIGFVSYVYRQLGHEVGSTPAAVLSAGTRVPASQARPGDIIYTPGHVAIYIGDGQNIGAWNEGMGTRIGPNSWLGAPTYIRVG